MDSRDIEQASVWPPGQIEEMSLPVAHQLILIKSSKSPFDWLVVTLFGLALDWHWTGIGLAPDWLRTKVPYLLLPYLAPQQLPVVGDQGMKYTSTRYTYMK